MMCVPLLGVQDVTADHAASHLGKAETIVTLLRAASYYRSCRRVCIPMDVLMRVRSGNAVTIYL